jgi:hypothetical protein
MRRILQWAITAIAPFLSLAAERNSPESAVTRISVLGRGKILLDGKEATLSEVRRSLEKAKAKKHTIWYYRESGKGEPPPPAIEVFKFLVENKLPISLSTNPDFSDYVDEKGQSHPRK